MYNIEINKDMMKCVLILVLTLMCVPKVSAQINRKIQKGIVRSQSFVNRSSIRIVGAIIQRSGNNVNPVVSVETPEKGYFELALNNIENSNGIYYITSVKGPKGTQYKLLYPTRNDKLQYMPNSSLTIIMQSNKELDDYASYVKEKALREAKIKFESEKRKLEEKCKQGEISSLIKDRKIEELQKKIENFNDLIYDYIRETLQNTDYEILDERYKKISVSIENGDYSYADSLLNWRTNEDREKSFMQAKNELEKAEQYMDIKRAEYEKTKNNVLFEEDKLVQSALGQLDFDRALEQMKHRLSLDSTNVVYLFSIGDILEKIYTDYKQALIYYQKALRNIDTQTDNTFQESVACYNHLGDVYSRLGEYNLAENYYSKALSILDKHNETHSRSIYDSFLGLGHVCNNLSKFDKAESLLKKCIDPSVEEINKNAFWQAQIGLAFVRLTKTDYQNAQKMFASIVNEVSGRNDINTLTLSSAYEGLIKCMNVIGKYQNIIDTCEVAKSVIKKKSTKYNTYIADILIMEGNAYNSLGKIKESKECFVNAMRIYQDILGEEHPDYAGACIQFANYYVNIGKFHDANNLADQAINLLMKKFGEKHLSLLDAYGMKFQVYINLAEYDKAQAALDTIRDIYINANLWNEYNKINIKQNEAFLKIQQDDYANALNSFLEARDCIVKTIGENSNDLTNIYSKISLCYMERGEYNDAKTYMEKSMALANSIYGKDTPAALVNNIGMGLFYNNRGEFKKAFEIYSYIEEKLREYFDESSYLFVPLYDYMGNFYLGQNNFIKAKAYFEKLYEVVEKTYGEHHVFMAEPLMKMGAYYIAKGEFRKGLEYEQKSNEIQTIYFGGKSKRTFMSQVGMASAYMQLGKYDQAKEILSNLEQTFCKDINEKNWYFYLLYEKIGGLYFRAGDFTEAIKYTNKAIALIERSVGKNNSQACNLYNMLAEIYLNKCDFIKAFDYNKIAIEIAESFYGKNQPSVMPMFQTKADIYATLNRYTDAYNIYETIKNTYAKFYGDNCLQMSPVKMAEASLLIQEGKITDALLILENIQDKYFAIWGESSSQMLAIDNLLASAYLQDSQVERAKSLFVKALEIAESNFGKNSAACISPLTGLGNFFLNFDVDLDMAKMYFNRASIASSFAFGPNHVNTQIIDASIASISLRQGKLQEAFKVFKRYLTTVQQTLGTTSTVHTRLAEAYAYMGQYYLAKVSEAMSRGNELQKSENVNMALDCFKKANAVTEKIFGEKNVGAIGYLKMMAQTYLLKQDMDSAFLCFKKSADITLETYSKKSTLTALAYTTLADLLEYESNQNFNGIPEKLQMAYKYYTDAIEIIKITKMYNLKNFNYQMFNWRMAQARICTALKKYVKSLKLIDGIIHDVNMLGKEYNTLRINILYASYINKAYIVKATDNNFEDALLLLQKADSIVVESGSTNKFDRYSLVNAYANIYESMGKNEDAVRYYEELLEMMRQMHSASNIMDIVKAKIKMLKSLNLKN